jgi:TonB family protein
MPDQAAASPAAAAPMAPAANEVLAEQRTLADTVALVDPEAPKKARAQVVSIDKMVAARTTAVMPATPTIAPVPAGGVLALREYLRREAQSFDPEINALRLTGNVHVRFVVDADGQVSNLKILRGLRADYDAEALRIVCEGPTWLPGIERGRRAPLPVELRVPF